MNIGVIFGGKSCEHDISIITGVMTVNAVSIKHNAVPVYIDGNGQWYTDKSFNSVEVFANKLYKKKKVHLRPSSSFLHCNKGKKVQRLDAVIICCHGLNGEDGTLSGLLELSGIPYAASNVLASAVGMDKLVQKCLYKHYGLNVTPFIGIDKREFEQDGFSLSEVCADVLQFPVMVKPVSLGSSIGITKAKDLTELAIMASDAFKWDNKIIVENALEDFIEVNCAVAGVNSLLVSAIEQPLSNGFLSYRDKYEGGDKGSSGRYLPAHISEAMTQEVKATAQRVYRIVGCSGVARIDFLIKDDVLYVNEINTVPGSLSSYLFDYDGIDFCDLVDKLLEGAFESEKAKRRLRYTFDSNVLSNVKGFRK